MNTPDTMRAALARARIAAICPALLLLIGPANAAVYTWDPGVSAGVQSGGGVWDTGGANTVWTTTDGASNVAWADGNSATFAGDDSGGTISLTANRTVGGTLSFLNSGYVLQSSNTTVRTITMNSTPLLLVAAGKSMTIGANAQISGPAIGSAATAFGTINLTGGTLTNSSNFTIRGDGTRINVNAGGTLSAGGSYIMGGNAGDNITIVVDGGVMRTTGGNGNLGMINSNVSNASATLTLKDGEVTLGGTIAGQSVLRMGSVTSGTGSSTTVNLDGGVMTVGSVTESGGAASTFNFNGGVLKAKASANAATFMSNIDNALVKAGGAKFDSNGQDLVVAQLIAHDSALGAAADGGFEKLGTGSVTFSAANTYTGVTTVTAGTLATDATGVFGSGDLTVAGGAGLTLGNALSIDDSASLLFGTGSTISLNFLGEETLGSVIWSGGGSIAAGTYTASQLNAFFGFGGGGEVFFGTGSLTVTAIPEPSAFALLAGAGALAFGVRRRR